MTRIYDGANWTRPDDNFTQTFYDQNRKQLWFPDEVALAGDLLDWKAMSKDSREVFKKALAGLTMLDTQQGDIGVPEIQRHVTGHQRKALLNFMAMMENFVHAKSYSVIFQTLASSEEIRDLFDWIEENKYLQKKASIIVEIYENIKNGDSVSIFKGLVASVFLETFLFYSGFYYPLYLYGQGEMMQSGEIINLIIRDESIHGIYIGMLAQEIFNEQSEELKGELSKWVVELLLELYENEILYTEDIYDSIDLTHDVKKFVRYNANKALMNLGFTTYFETEEINPVVLSGLDTITKSHDFFSMKGNGYVIAIIEPVQNSDFYFN